MPPVLIKINKFVDGASMDPITLIGLLALGGSAGVLGAMFGLGGGFIFVPVLMLVFNLAPAEAAAVSLIGIIAGSVGASTVLVDKGLSNVRLGLLMEITTAAGAIIGAFVATLLEEWIMMVIFSIIVFYSGVRMLLNPTRTVTEEDEVPDSPLTFEYQDDLMEKPERYRPAHMKSGMLMCTAAGMISSMTGVGGGAVKVPLMNIYMHVPIKAASATSSYMIGITAFSGAIAYFLGGQVILTFAACVALGAFLGSLVGARINARINARYLTRYFSILLFVVSILVLLRAGGIL